jgi:hypothetical protein
MKHFAVLLLSAVTMSACVPMVETRVNSVSHIAGDVSRAYQMPVVEESSPELMLAQRLVVERLTALKFMNSSAPFLNLEVTISVRPASLALASGATVISAANLKKASAKCANLDVRLGVTITQISDGKQSYRASASEVHCNPNLNAVLPVLVNAALDDLSKDGVGAQAYVLKRKLR